MWVTSLKIAVNFSMPIERKSAAVMFTDIAGYTKVMSRSEKKALTMLRKKRSIVKHLLDNHKGTFVKEIITVWEKLNN